MAFISYPRKENIQRVENSGSEQELETYFGLPRHIQYCSRCTYSNQKPNSEREIAHNILSQKPTLKLDEEGVCSACIVADKKKEIDWISRERELRDICDKYRKEDGSYDCLVPGSGGKDSFYSAYVLKHVYGMHPLTVTMTPHMYTTWGWDNFQNWIDSGFDNYLFSPDRRIHRLLTRISLEKLFHPFQPFIMGQMYLPPKIALRFGIPLVFYGENPIEYGNEIGSGLVAASKDYSFYSMSNKSKIYIAGTSYDELIDCFKLSPNSLAPYLPATENEVKDKKLDVQYLGYYLPWHPQDLYYFAVENSNFKPSPERTSGTYSKYSSIDDKLDDFHYYCTYIKFGIGRATYDSSQEIRNGEITRDEGIALVNRYDGEYPKRFEREIFEYLSLSEREFPDIETFFEEPKMNSQYFQDLTDKFRSPHIWKLSNGRWELRKSLRLSEEV